MSDSDSTLSLDFSQRAIPPAEQAMVQEILDRDLRGYSLVAQIEPPTTIVNALRDQGLSPAEMQEYLAKQDTGKVTVPTVDISPSWGEVCDHYAPNPSERLQDDEASIDDDAQPNAGTDLRMYRVRGVGDTKDLDRKPERSFTVIVSLQSGRVVAIN